MGRLGRLEALHLDHNGFAGALPGALGDLGRLELWNASHCRFDGVLPVRLGAMTRLKALFLGHNALEGTLDALAPLGSPTGALVELYANDNRLDVSEPPASLRGLNVLFVVRNAPPD